MAHYGAPSGPPLPRYSPGRRADMNVNIHGYFNRVAMHTLSRRDRRAANDSSPPRLRARTLSAPPPVTPAAGWPLAEMQRHSPARRATSERCKGTFRKKNLEERRPNHFCPRKAIYDGKATPGTEGSASPVPSCCSLTPPEGDGQHYTLGKVAGCPAGMLGPTKQELTVPR